MAKRKKNVRSATRQAQRRQQSPDLDKNPAHNLDERSAYAGRPDQEIKKTTGPGAGGATDWGKGNKNHPSRIAGKPPGT